MCLSVGLDHALFAVLPQLVPAYIRFDHHSNTSSLYPRRRTNNNIVASHGELNTKRFACSLCVCVLLPLTAVPLGQGKFARVVISRASLQ